MANRSQAGLTDIERAAIQILVKRELRAAAKELSLKQSMRSISDYLRRRLADVPGIADITATLEGGRQIIRINGATATVGPFASDTEIEKAIRSALNMPDQNEQTEIHTTELPPAPAVVATKAACRPAQGSFAASLRAMMDEARAGVAKAREDGLAEVKDAVSKLGEAKAEVTRVTGSMAKTIKDEAADVMAELGQISNMGPE